MMLKLQDACNVLGSIQEDLQGDWLGNVIRVQSDTKTVKHYLIYFLRGIRRGNL